MVVEAAKSRPTTCLNESAVQAGDREHFLPFKPREKTVTIYQNYQFYGPSLSYFSMYEYCTQVSNYGLKAKKRASATKVFFEYDKAYLQFATYIQELKISVESLNITCLIRGFTKH